MLRSLAILALAALLPLTAGCGRSRDPFLHSGADRSQMMDSCHATGWEMDLEDPYTGTWFDQSAGFQLTDEEIALLQLQMLAEQARSSGGWNGGASQGVVPLFGEGSGGYGGGGDNFWTDGQYSAGNYYQGNQQGYVWVPGVGAYGYGF